MSNKNWKERIPYLFPQCPYRQNIKYGSEDELSFVTPYSQAKWLNRLINFIFMWKIDSYSGYDIIECCGGIGGNTINFMLCGNVNKVITFENDKSRFQNLVENLKLYKPKGWSEYKVKLINRDFITNYKKEIVNENSVVFLDPPWGGKDYKDIKEITMKDANNKTWTLPDIVKDVLATKNVAMLCIKIPKVYDVSKFNFKEYHCYVKGNTQYVIVTRSIK